MVCVCVCERDVRVRTCAMHIFPPPRKAAPFHSSAHHAEATHFHLRVSSALILKKITKTNPPAPKVLGRVHPDGKVDRNISGFAGGVPFSAKKPKVWKVVENRVQKT